MRKKTLSNVESSKSLALVGSILLLLFWIPYGGVVLGIIGIILFMIGVKGLADFYHDNAIYQNALTGVIFYIIALVAVAISVVGLVIGFFTLGLGFILGIAGLVIAFVFYILSASHLRTTFSDLAQKSGEQSFNTAGSLLWWGAILTIIFVGLLLIFLAWIFAAIGFSSMKPSQQQQQPFTYTPPPPVSQPTPAQPSTQTARFCPNCGAPVDANATFCPHCGTQLKT